MRGVLRRNSQNTHHHPQRERARDLADKLAFSSEGAHAIEAIARHHADAVLQGMDPLLREPGLAYPAVFGVIRRIHVDQRADEMRTAAGQRAYPLVGTARDQRGRTVAIVKSVVLPAD